MSLLTHLNSCKIIMFWSIFFFVINMNGLLSAALQDKPGRFQIQQCRGFRWRRLLASVCGPELCWSCEPATWTGARTWPLPAPPRQSRPAGQRDTQLEHFSARGGGDSRPNASKHTCSLVCAFCTYSRPTLILGVRMARVNSSTLMPSRWHSFWAAVLSGMEAWSWCFSFMKEMFPNWSTAEMTLSMAADTERGNIYQSQRHTQQRAHFSAVPSFTYVLFWCEAHDSHGVHGLGEVLWITLTRNRDGSTSEKAILINTSQQQLL